MSASPARLLAAARHLVRMEAVRLLEVGYDVPAEQRLSASKLVELTMDPADELITSLLLNTGSKAKGSSAC